MHIARVAVEGTLYSFDTLYDYIIPAELERFALPGTRVCVSFGTSKKPRIGFIFHVNDNKIDAGKKLKKISSVLDEHPVLSDEMIELAEFISERTFCTLYEAAKVMLPAGMCINIVDTYIINPEITDLQQFELTGDALSVASFLLEKKSYYTKEQICKKFSLSAECDIIDSLVNTGVLCKGTDALKKFSGLHETLVELSDDYDDSVKLTSKQRLVVDTLLDIESASIKELCYFTGVSPAVIKTLVNKNILVSYESECFKEPDYILMDEPELVPISLSQEQSDAYSSLTELLDCCKFSVSMLFGVTGSGKTMVYMRLIDDLIKKGQGIILLVPEISLTSQVIKLFTSRYGRKIAVLHSQLSYTEKAAEWNRIETGEAQIVIGTRSAIFAPVNNLHLIIIDEEQEHTYKSDKTPRYDAIEVAKFRCKKNNALLILASATPTVRDYAFASMGKYPLFELNTRYSKAKLPTVKTVDISQTTEMEHRLAISRTLETEIKNNLDKKEQSILLVNRRGFSTFIACRKCKKVLSCPNCSSSLTYHISNNRLMCHYCGYSQTSQNKCPACGSETIRYSGFGTQKAQQELEILFPDARIVRMDADTTIRKNSHSQLLKSFADGEYDILVGTQMIAKGLNFPNVTLVGVLSTDQQLFNDDYRGSEKTFSLLTQVIGRAGRMEKEGRAIIQTFEPENSIIKFASSQDYKKFFEYENIIRKSLVYPPYCDICVISFSGPNEGDVSSSAQKFLNCLELSVRENYIEQKIIVLGPAAPKISKINNKYRKRIIIKCRNSSRFRQMISSLIKDFMKNTTESGVTVWADINPNNIL